MLALSSSTRGCFSATVDDAFSDDLTDYFELLLCLMIIDG
jgi:hypothetical protein